MLEIQSSLDRRHLAFSTTDIEPPTPGDWGNYARGACAALRAAPLFRTRDFMKGFRGWIWSEMPVGGLSSSAAVTISYLLALEASNGLFARPDENVEMVRHCENLYLGLNNGILDQSVILNSHRQELTVIDCRQRVTKRLATTGSPPWEIVVVYSGLSRQLVQTPFNARVAECKEAAAALLGFLGRTHSSSPILSDVSIEEFEREKHRLPQVLRSRATHFFTEQDRVRTGCMAWEQGDWQLFGQLINASGESSINNYQAGCPELISLYEILRETSGVLGTRFCGGGFKGCCFALVEPAHRDAILSRVHEEYSKRHPEAAKRYSMHLCTTADAANVRSAKEVLCDC